MREAELSLVRLSAALGSGEPERLDAALAASASAAEPEQIEEVLVQSYLFLGYPAALNALAKWRKLRPEAPAPTGEDPAGWPGRGEAVCERVYGGTYGRLRANIAALHPDMERWMLSEGYGKVLGRPGLELRTRELCIAALLAGQRAEPQLFSHLRGALNVGASVEDVEAALQTASAELPPERAAAALRVWQDVRKRRDARAGNGMEG